ncbi:MAG: glycosyl hydrolase 115 family protein [Blautia sp.]|nr:glycosyl hydrolase 115 family protein [Blautia sp.]MCM1200377.1 glycosyl hydrolase 115 family protein [Bacteroides fragilis]
MEWIINGKKNVFIKVSEKEPAAVKIAAGNLETDLKKVFQEIRVSQDTGAGKVCQNPEEEVLADFLLIYIGTLGISEQFDEWVDLEKLRDEKGKFRKEACQIRVHEGALVIAGTDRRGTVYGIYSLCERLGVSPWYFWADVPVRERECFSLPEDTCVTDWPSVEYRGIFINDEEELEAWAKNYMDEPTIGVKTYEKIFELLLRLKANYIWPAMHVNSFNRNPENGALAQRMGIVVGTSHCDMLMRSNNREWLPWLEEKGYTDAVYDYSIEGRNREILQEYWRESVEQNRDFEVCYTIGMRGIHDSGFETSMLGNGTEEERRRAKKALLERVIQDQCGILQETLGKRPMMTFIPYKEVLALYDDGLRVPEDVTLVWANDNYGHIRRFPSAQEKERKGGHGIYYHNSYWAPSGMSYVFLCSIPLAQTRNELQKAWDEGIRKLWVLNSGSMKPLEQEISFFLRLAWEIGREGALTEDVEAFSAAWIDGNFSGGIGRETAALLHDFAQLTNVRKLENMEAGVFSQTAYGDEAAVRIHRYETLFERGNALYAGLPEKERDAFYQMVLMRIHAGYFTNLAYYYGDRSTLMYERGSMQAAALYTKRARQFEDARRSMILYYNTVMAGGKWKGIVDPEGYPPPRAAMMPLCTPPLIIKEGPRMRVDLWNGGEALEFASASEKWIEIGNAGTGTAPVSIEAPEWLRITAADAGSGAEEESIVFSENGLRAEVATELRVCLRAVDDVIKEMPDGGAARQKGFLIVRSLKEGTEKRIPVRTARPASEEDGLIVLEGDCALNLESNTAFCRIPRLGRCYGDLIEAVSGGGEPLLYSFVSRSAGSFLLEICRFPSLNATGRLRIGVSLDEEPVRTLEASANDEWRGSWKRNVLDDVERLFVTLPHAEAGKHSLRLYAVDPYFAFSRLLLYTEPRKENGLAGITGSQRLPEKWDAERWCAEFYGKMENGPRAVAYIPARPAKDTLEKLGGEVRESGTAAVIEPSWYLARGCRIFEEQDGAVRIDAAAAIPESSFGEAAVFAGRRFAWMCGEWRHCAGESFGRSGLCLYVREGEGGSVDGGGIGAEIEKKAPSLHYRFICEGGHYTLWMLVKFRDADTSRYHIGIDGIKLWAESLYNGGSLFRYESEQIYQWAPAAAITLSKGGHVLDVYSTAAGMRFDRFYLTRGEEWPPADTVWSRLEADTAPGRPQSHKTS